MDCQISERKQTTIGMTSDCQISWEKIKHNWTNKWIMKLVKEKKTLAGYMNGNLHKLNKEYIKTGFINRSLGL